ncbi:hypothetical protein LXA43DRAFT_1099703 [Ganoderma leucocontextum]|nr:hypothetical protein LXA43DRAFT_1099703 [Ganoderma leucocontextum]
MPERTEIYVQHQQLCNFLTKTSDDERILQGIWVDCYYKQLPYTTDPRAKQGLVYKVTSTSDIWEGNPCIPSDEDRWISGVYPSPLPLGCDIETTPYLLSESPFNPESILLIFASWEHHEEDLKLLNLLLHTSVQIFTSHEWFNVIAVVPMHNRGYKVAVAFELSNYVVAFLTKDHIFHIRWANELSDLPSRSAHDVIYDWNGFLGGVAEWIEQRRRPRCATDGSAFKAIHGASCFPGLGVYFLSEVFNACGFDISLPESAILSSPSRQARLCLGFRATAMNLQDHIWPSVARFFYGFKVGVERADRLRYTNFLKVYGKNLV